MRRRLDIGLAGLDLKAGAKSKDAVFDRFGICCIVTGGAQVKVWFDDLIYTVGKP
ncbi:MAG: hypothetical protein ABIP20_14860 [Chthoniobacteraceae bacterium]